MKDVIVTVYGNGSVSTPNNMLFGYDGENIARKLIIKLDNFIDGVAMLEIRQNNKEYSLAMEKEEETYFLPIQESLLAYPEIDMQFILIVGEETIYKSAVFTFYVGESINAIDSNIIKEYASFIVTAKEKLTEIESVVSDLNEKIESDYFKGKDGDQGPEGPQGVQGEKGEPGEKGTPFLYEDFTEEQLENLRGPAGKDGQNGQDGTNGIDGKDGQDGKDGTNGLDGENGATFTPSIDEEGNLSWTNDKGLPNPATVNIKGPEGSQGEAGANGQDGIVDYAQVNAYIDEKIGNINTILATLTTPPESEVK